MKINRYILLLCLISILILPISIATSDWENPGKDISRIGRQDPTFSSGFSSLIPDIDTTADGDYFQPLVQDFDNDGVVEILAWSGNSISIYSSSITGQIQLESQLNVGFNQPLPPFAADFDGDGLIDFLINSRVQARVFRYEYDGNTITQINNASYTGSPRQGFTCDDTNSGVWTCYVSTSAGDIVEYLPIAGTTSAISFSGSDIFLSHTSSSQSVKYLVPCGDIDNSGGEDCVFPVDPDFNDNEGIFIFDSKSNSVYTGFAFPTGYIDNLETGSLEEAEILSAIVYNLDGGGLEEVCVNYHTKDQNVGGLDQEGWLQCYNGDGTEYDTRKDLGNITIESFTSDIDCSNIVLADIDGVGQLEVCGMCEHDRTGGDATEFYLRCYSTDGGSLTEAGYFRDDTKGTGTYYITQDYTRIAAADMNGDGLDDIVSPRVTFFSDGVGGFTTSGLYSGQPNLHMSVADINSDGILDIVGMTSGYLTFILSDATNDPPVLNNSIQSGGYLGYYNSPVCEDTSITFTASQVGNNKNYYNDVDTDQERLVTNCGTGSTLDNGTFSGISPSYSCYYNNSGTYAVTLYLQDEVNNEDFSQFNTDSIIISVIDGINGVTCNLDLVSIEDLSTEETQSQNQINADNIDDSVDLVQSSFLGLSDTMRWLVGLALALGISSFMFKYGALAGVVGIIMGLAISMLFGLIEIWLFILLLIAMVLVLIGYAVFRSGGGGG